jgi:hypothetical protein
MRVLLDCSYIQIRKAIAEHPSRGDRKSLIMVLARVYRHIQTRWKSALVEKQNSVLEKTAAKGGSASDETNLFVVDECVPGC